MSDTGDGTIKTLSAGAGRIDVTGGRVTTLAVEGSAGRQIDSIAITKPPAHGNVTVNPDGTLALVLTTSSHSGSLGFDYEVTYDDGSTAERKAALKVVPGAQDAGWGTGDLFTLQTDDDDRTIVEPGQNHRKVYVSAGNDALTAADIAAREGIPKHKVTTDWLGANPRYGGSEDLPLAPEVAMPLWYDINDRDMPANSDWLLFKSDHEYDDLGRLVARGSDGESALHPVLIGAWGAGDRPVIKSDLNLYQYDSKHHVIRDLQFENDVQILRGENILLENISVTGQEGMNIQNVDGFTLRNSEIIDVVREDSITGKYWRPAENRISGLFAKENDGILIEGVFADRNGWSPDYDYGGSLKYGQPPSYYNHNIYLQNDNTDVTFRDNITMRGASFGAQIRSGGFIEDNVFIDNNAALNSLGGNYKGAGPIGHYSYLSGNVITSAGYKTVDHAEGALSMGLGGGGLQTTLVDNIIAHLADPANPDELAEKYVTHEALGLQDPYYNDTIIYNWVGAKHYHQRDQRNENVEGLDEAVLDRTTIQVFTQELLGKGDATIEDLADHLRAQAEGRLDDVVDADLVIAFFQEGFGIANVAPLAAETLRFVPDDKGDGIRWDNDANWSKGYLPGAFRGDSVDLGGNWVNFGGTVELSGLDLGSGGKLWVRQGYLEVDGIETGGDGGTIEIDDAGQLWAGGYAGDDLLTLRVDGGRFAATGRFDGRVDMTVTGGETILATGGGTFGLGQGSSLVFADADIDVGFDGPSGTGTFVMDGDATLGFVAEKNRIAGITEFRSGHWGLDAPGLQSVVDLGAGGTTLALDLAEKGPKTLRADLIDVDRLIGAPGAIDVSGITSSTRVTVTVDYARDAVALVAGTSGSGPKMRLHFQGSDDADVFHLGDLDAFFATVSGFRTDDIVDVTGLLRATGEDAGAIGFRSLDDGETELVLDGEAVARISHDPGLGAFGVEEAGGRTTVTVGSGSGSGSSGGNGNGGDSDDGSDSSDGGNGDGSDGGNGDGSGNDGNDSGDNAGGDGGGSDNGDGGDVSPDPGPENRAPVAGPESFAGSEDSRISGSLTAQDADGDALSYAAAVGPTHGTLTVESDGSFTYDPDADFSGADSFVYQVSDGRLSDTATVNLEVTEVNDAPTGGNDDVTARADGRTVTGNLLVNDTDPDGDDLSVAGIDTGGTRGEVVHNGDGTFTYDPGDAFARLGSSQTATDSFRYRLEDTRGGTDMVTVTVTVQGTVPAPNMIRGTDGRDEIAGTDKNDVIRSLGGNFDRMSGGEKADAFVFGKETRDGTQERDFILDYEVGRDFLALEDGARIASISDTATGAVVYFEGDNDAVYLVGDGLNAGSLSVLVVDDFSPYDWFVG